MHGQAENPTQKPVELIKPLIHYGSFGDGWVISPFCGSGTDLVAAKEMGRCAIGMEIDEAQCEVAARRLSQEVLPLA
jgi:site-specific DNA-methyltransferase (adenine-specific)